MPRKSRVLRLSQATALSEAYEAARMTDDYRARFVRDMAARLDRGRGLSKKQRDWLDSLITEGVPAPKGDSVLIARIEAAITVEGMREFDVNMLGEFLTKVRNDWKMSEKQTKWLNDLLVAAEKIAADGPWAPTEEQMASLQLCLKLAKGYSNVYWETHGGTAKALQSVQRYIEGADAADEWCVNKLIKSMARPLRELENPKFTPGEMYWLFVSKTYPERGGDYAPALVADGPFVSDKNGKVVYSVLVNGEIIETDNVTKQRRRTG